MGPAMVRVTLIRGDGIGPEITTAAVAMIEATKVPIDWDEQQAGASAVATHSTPFPKATLESIRENKVALKAPLTTPVGGGYRSVNVGIRQELDLYANVRPVRTFDGLKNRYSGVDLVVVRENTQGLYSGIEHFIDPRKDAAQAISFISRYASERVIRYAFEYARRNKRNKVTLVHKANILKLTTGLFLQVGRELAEQYPDIQFEDRIVDAMAMNLVIRPEAFDVLVTTNLFGDILSDLTAGLIGGLGLAPGANHGDEVTIYEAIHGTAPDIAGRGIANPTALTLSGCMMLRDLGFVDEGNRLETAIRNVIDAGETLTPDLGGTANTDAFAEAVIRQLDA